MRIILLSVIVLVMICLNPQIVLAQIDMDNLYKTSWRLKEKRIIAPEKIITIYSREKQSGTADYGNIMLKFSKADGICSGFDLGGDLISTNFHLLSGNRIIIGSDAQPSNIIKLTSDEYIVQNKYPHTDIESGKTIEIVNESTFMAFDPCAVFETLHSGNWNDPTIWTCQKLPTANDKVLINRDHKVIIPADFNAYAKSVETNGIVDLKSGAKLTESQQ